GGGEHGARHQRPGAPGERPDGELRHRGRVVVALLARLEPRRAARRSGAALRRPALRRGLRVHLQRQGDDPRPLSRSAHPRRRDVLSRDLRPYRLRRAHRRARRGPLTAAWVLWREVTWATVGRFVYLPERIGLAEVNMTVCPSCGRSLAE